MTNEKNPTNADIYRKLDHMDVRIGALEQWKIAEDAAKAAIEKYKRDEQLDLSNKETRSKYELFKQAAYVLAIIGMILYAYVSFKGGHP